MATDVLMPQMGADMEEGTLLHWLKHAGEHVSRGEVIAEIETDKANVEIESFEEGVLTETLVEEGQIVPVGQPIARIGPAGEVSAAAPAPAENSATKSDAPPPSDRPASTEAAGPTPARRDEREPAKSVAEDAAQPSQARSRDAEPAIDLAPRASAAPADAGGRVRISPVAR
ncbi:MAG: biotin/lipoyl-containing protein, partial [Dehalococcoidia bacterium]